MARTNESGEQLNAADAWARAAANRKYGIHNGVPYVGAEGHVVPLPVPGDWFANVPTVSQGTVFQALAEYVGNRVAQPTAKAENATHDAVVAAAASALTNGFDPARSREKDPVEAEVERQFAALVRAKVLEQKPDATDEQIEAFTAKQATTDAGKAKLAEFRETILNSGTYSIQRKTRKGTVADLGIGEISL
jgi:hypothetical protein